MSEHASGWASVVVLGKYWVRKYWKWVVVVAVVGLIVSELL